METRLTFEHVWVMWMFQAWIEKETANWQMLASAETF